jgi:hypothetical protein
VEWRKLSEWQRGWKKRRWGGKMSQRQEKEAAQPTKTVAVLGGKVLAKLFGEVW